MTDFRDDDTQLWEDPEWNRGDDIPAIRSDDDSVTRSHWLGQLARDVTGAVPRTRTHSFERTRTHHVVTSRPSDQPHADATDDWAPVDHWLEPEPNQRRAAAAVDPRLIRIGAVGLVGVLMIPVALALREDDESVRGDEASAVTTTVAPQLLAAPTVTTVTVPPTAAPVAPAPADGQPHDDASYQLAAAVSEEPDEPVCAGTYIVIANDFWNRFPRTSGASVEKWLAANNATPDTPLYVGDELCIPAGAVAPDPPPATTAPPTTAAPVTTPAPAPVVAAAPAPPPPAATTPPAPVVTQAPAPPPVVTQPPAPIPAGAPSTVPLCGALPTSNGNPAGTPGPAEVEAIIREVWPDELEARALCIAKNEAKLRADLNNYCCYGVFAIYFRWVADDLRATFGIDEPADLYNARTNIALAYQLYLRSGWDPWSQTDPGSG